MRDKKLILLVFVTGSLCSIGNVFIIFAIKAASEGGSSPAVIVSILMMNVMG